jgi:hypothetical protein
MGFTIQLQVAGVGKAAILGVGVRNLTTGKYTQYTKSTDSWSNGEPFAKADEKINIDVFVKNTGDAGVLQILLYGDQGDFLDSAVSSTMVANATWTWTSYGPLGVHDYRMPNRNWGLTIQAGH